MMMIMWFIITNNIIIIHLVLCSFSVLNAHCRCRFIISIIIIFIIISLSLHHHHHHAIIIITIIIIIIIIIIFVIILIIIINPVWVNIAESPRLTLSPMDIFGKIPQKTSSAIFLKRSQWNILIVSNLLVGSAKEFAALVSPMMYFFQPGLCSTTLWNITN